MIVLSAVAVPLYHRLRIYTAYQYLEHRFDARTRSLAALLFLLQRGLAAGLTIFAPAIILSTILGWNLYWTNLLVGGMVVIYTTAGGTRSVNFTHLLQMLIIFVAFGLAFYIALSRLPEPVGLWEAAHIAGKLGRLKAIDFSFDPNNRYTLWSGLLGGFFLQLSYFGTDQSQVQRYLTGRSVTHSRMALLANGLLKIPMQFFVLSLGVLVFVFYQFHSRPIFFNTAELKAVRESPYRAEFKQVEGRFLSLQQTRARRLLQFQQALQRNDQAQLALLRSQLEQLETQLEQVRAEAITVLKKSDPLLDPNDANFVFLRFVLDYLPPGVVGLIIAAIIAASMSSTASELNALASTTVVDFYRRFYRTSADEKTLVRVSRWATVLWGAYAIVLAQFASRLGSLIEAVNVVGSLFYGTILGIFCVAFFMRAVGGRATFLAALIAQGLVFLAFAFTGMSFLWYNLIGCLSVMVLARLLQFTSFASQQPPDQRPG
ncbi:MAG: sodium:solute symporter [Calditrichaeota bacterium]|nr:MAG: sodium:solute symporter [Calditrichota bacterium]